MNSAENGHNHIQEYIKGITKDDLEAPDMRMIASSTIELFNKADQTQTEGRGVSLLVSVLRDREKSESIADKKGRLIIAGIVWHALAQTQRSWIDQKLNTYEKLPGIDESEIQRIKVRFTTFIDSIDTLR